jgi:two-component system cell cycle sensor histidine kinase/response regulator CckA
VESEPGRGASFRVFLPRVVGETDAEAAAEDAPRPGSETILLVEDEEMVRGFARSVLQMNGYSVLEAASAEEALGVAADHAAPIALLLTDVVMPRMSGRELAERFAELRPDTRILFMTGYTDDVVVRHGVTQTGAHLIEKPFSPASLTRKVREILEAV